MKKTYRAIGLMCALCLAVCVSMTSRAAPTQQEQAQMLYNLGLFKGTEQGFELERVMTRGEAAVMLVRLLGAEEQALEQNNACPYADVPEWCQPYVGWLHTNKLTNGTSPTTYSPQKDTTYEQYSLFLNRALGYGIGEEYFTFMPEDKEYPKDKMSPILRGEAVEESCSALSYRINNSKMTLAWDLIFQGVLKENQLRQEISETFGELVVGSILNRTGLGEEESKPRFYVIGSRLCISDPATGDMAPIAQGIDYPYDNSWEWGHHVDGFDFILQRLPEQDEKYAYYKIVAHNEFDHSIQEIIPKWRGRPSMWIEKEGLLYIFGLSGLYQVQYNTGDVTQLSSQAIDRGGYILAPDGLIVVGLDADDDDAAFLIDSQGEGRELFPGLFKKANTHITTLKSYDGETLIFQSMRGLTDPEVTASTVYYWYEYEATAEGITCLRLVPMDNWEGFRDYLGFKGNYEEFDAFMVEVEQKRIDEGGRGIGLHDFWRLTGLWPPDTVN